MHAPLLLRYKVVIHIRLDDVKQLNDNMMAQKGSLHGKYTPQNIASAVIASVLDLLGPCADSSVTLVTDGSAEDNEIDTITDELLERGVVRSCINCC